MNEAIIKKCNECGIDKAISEFYIRKDRKNLVRSRCKECEKKGKKEYNKKNKEKKTKYMRSYYIENKESLSETKKEYYKNNKVKIKEYREKYYKENKEKLLEESRERNRIYYIKNKEKIIGRQKKYNDIKKEYKKEYYKNYVLLNKEKKQEYSRKYRELNKDRINIYQKSYIDRSPQNKIKRKISARIRECLERRNSSKLGKSTWHNILSYSPEELKLHLEFKFESGMTWKNYGNGLNKWCIDHVIPDSSFDYKFVEDEEFKKSWALENLQPMWFNENCSKNNRYSGKFIKYFKTG